jgi:hypothetical protein
LESPRVRRLLDRRKRFQLSARIIAIILSVSLFFWLLAANADMNRVNRFGATTTGQLIGWLFFASLGLDIVLDFAAIVASVNGFSREVIAGRWDLLRLTPYTAGELLAVKHSAARLRVWRMTMLVSVIRLVVMILFLLTTAFNSVLYGYLFNIGELWAYLPALPAVLAYLVEPIWRAQVMTLLGLMISIQVRNALSLTLAAVGAVLAFWVFQLLILGGFFWITLQLLNSLFYPIVIDPFVTDVIIFIMATYIAVVFYLFYTLIQKLIQPHLSRWIDYAEA